VHGLLAVVRDGDVFLVDPRRPDRDVISVPGTRQYQLGGWWPDRAWSPAGERLALTSDEHVYLLDPGSLEILAVPGAAGFPWRFNGWARGGREIVLHNAIAGVTRLLDLTTGTVRETQPPADRLGLLCYAVVSPDGEALATFDQGHHLFLYHIGTTAWVGLDRALRPPYGCADSDGAYNTPDWSPDSRSVVFVGDETLVVARADGSGRVDIATRDSEWTRPQWSPNGAWISYLRADGLHILHPDGSGERLLAAGRLDPASVDWSPDSARLEFARPTDTDLAREVLWSVDVATDALSRVAGSSMDQGGDAFAHQIVMAP